MHAQGRPELRAGRPVLGDGRRRHLVTGGTYEQVAANIEEDVRTSSGCLLMVAVAGPLLLLVGFLLVRTLG